MLHVSTQDAERIASAWPVQLSSVSARMPGRRSWHPASFHTGAGGNFRGPATGLDGCLPKCASSAPGSPRWRDSWRLQRRTDETLLRAPLKSGGWTPSRSSWVRALNLAVPGQSGAASQHAKRSWLTQCGIAPWHRPEQYSTSCGCHDDDTHARALWSILDLASTVCAQRLFSCCR